MKTTWSNTTRILVVVALLVATVWIVVVAGPLWQAVGIAALLAYLLDPLVRFLMCRTQMRRSWAAALIFVLLLLFLVGISALLGTVAVSQIHRLETDFLAAVGEIERWLSQPILFLNFRFHPQDLLGNLPTMAEDVLSTLPGGSLSILSSLTTNLLWGSVIVVTLYYLLKDGPKIKPALIRLAPDDYQYEVRRLLDEVNDIWGRFLRVQLLIFCILFALVAAGTLLVVWLFRSGLLQWSLVGFILLMLLVYTAAQQVDNLWLRPQFLGKHLRLHPGLVFVSMIGALALSGILGAFVVVPIIATMKVVGRYVHRKLLGLPPWPEEELPAGEHSQENTDRQVIVPSMPDHIPSIPPASMKMKKQL
jgi:predicted PurR-regulated permease PerM